MTNNHRLRLQLIALFFRHILYRDSLAVFIEVIMKRWQAVSGGWCEMFSTMLTWLKGCHDMQKFMLEREEVSSMRGS